MISLCPLYAICSLFLPICAFVAEPFWKNVLMHPLLYIWVFCPRLKMSGIKYSNIQQYIFEYLAVCLRHPIKMLRFTCRTDAWFLLIQKGTKKQKKKTRWRADWVCCHQPLWNQRAASCISMLLHALSAIWDKPKGLKYFSIFSGVHWQADTCNWEKTSAKSVWQKMGPVNKTNTHTKKMGAISAASSAIVFSDKRDVSLLRWGRKASQLLGNSIMD